MTETDPQKSEPAWLARILRLITDVQPGEAVTALLLTANVFFLLSAYYVLKPLREALILAKDSGAEYKSYLSGAIALFLFVLVPGYGKLVDALPRIKLVIGVNLAFAAQLLLFYVAIAIPGLKENLGYFFYVWVGIFNVMVVAQFWGYANDLYEKEQGERLFPMVAIGASVGAAVGSKGAKWLIEGLGEPTMLLVAAGLLVLCAGLYFLVERREGNQAEQAPASKPANGEEKKSKKGGFALVLGQRYLLLIALFALIYNWVNSNGEYMLSRVIQEEALKLINEGKLAAKDKGSAIGAAYADFFFYVNVAGVVLQTFVVSRVVRWLKLPTAFLFMPALALTNGFLFAFVPFVAKIGKGAENAIDYSLNNTLKQMLWLVTSPDMKYKAKQVVDTFCVRIGDFCSAMSVLVAVDLLKFSVPTFAWISIILAGIWLVIAIAIGRMYRGFEERKEKLGT
ncbi:MAG: carrier protein family protein [Polyangiaceae bacterium]|nr:carrier protein family protein [Polyangiaceae bacterium]